MNKIIIIIIIFYIYYYYKIIYKSNIQKITNIQNNKFKHTKKKTIKKITEGMMLVHDIFTKHNIFYQIAYGSLLGSIRHKKIIPWDDDADLHIYLKDIDKIMNLKQEFNKKGWTLEKNWKLLKVKQLDKNCNILEEVFIDLFIINIGKNDIIHRCLTSTQDFCKQMPINHKWWHKWYNFPKKLISGRKLYRFYDKSIGYDFMMYGPKNGKEILKFWYGNDCLKICQSPIYAHDTGKYIKSIKKPCHELNKKFNI